MDCKSSLKPNVPLGFFKDTIFVKNNSPSLPECPFQFAPPFKDKSQHLLPMSNLGLSLLMINRVESLR